MRKPFRMTLAMLATLGVSNGTASGGSQDELAYVTVRKYCTHPMVTVGIPLEYANAARGQFRYERPGAHQNQVCAVVAFGTPYQLVSWLENGSVQAAVLSDFAVSVMRTDEPQRFDEDYERFPVGTLLTLPRKERRMLLTDGAGVPEANTDGRLSDYLSVFKSQAEHPAEARSGQTIRLPSYLSPAVSYLVRYAKYWADEVSWKSDDDREEFYKLLLRSVRFADPVKPGAAADGASKPATLQLFDQAFDATDGKPLSPAGEIRGHGVVVSLGDRLVVRKSVLLADRDLRVLMDQARADQARASAADSKDKQTDADESEPGLFADHAIEEPALGPTLNGFRDANYRGVQFSTVTQRRFRFTIEELWTLLKDTDADAPPADAGKLALVLTGGGVKAAYQTRMLDALYDTQRLVGADAGAPRKPDSQQVQYVIGTSGGALLGVFVAAMDQKYNAVRTQSRDKKLTAVLWREPGIGIRSNDVFPYVDMLRYASLIMALVVVWIVSATMLTVFRGQYPQVKRFDHSNDSFFGRRRRGLRESWPWILVMLIAPVAILKIASVNRIEHVPVETGVYYAIMAMMVFYSDVRLFPSQQFAWRHAHLTWPAGSALMVATVLIVTAFARPGWLLALSPFDDPALIYVNLCGVGFVALLLALHLFFHSQREYFEPQPRRQILRAFAVLLGIVVLSYAGISLAIWANRTSLLEMNGGFWHYFLLFAAVITGVYMLLGRAPGEHQARSFPQETLGYLFSEYPSRAIVGSERRFMRFMTLNVLAWIWWNTLAAPALYGNGNARAYLTDAFCRFTELAHGESPQKCRADAAAPLSKAAEFPLAVPFVITATSLDKRKERYFLFVSGADNDAIDEKLPPQAWSNVVKDPRWVVVRKPVDKELRDVAFASGSPFPVFSAHDVQVRALKNPERLIDGGFAHNRPLEAAQALGARKVLVINSSPLEANGADAHCTLLTLRIGELACNLPKLVPYLWERSQVEDVLSTRNMVVASIYPTNPLGNWPALTDFRAQIVRDLIHEADEDVSQRVGVVESWGEPQFTEPAGLLGYDLGQIRSELRTY
jgi:predicted acylesterase/phospholipase RssA